MRQKERVEKVLQLLDEHYGTEYICYLEHENAWQDVYKRQGYGLCLYDSGD